MNEQTGKYKAFGKPKQVFWRLLLALVFGAVVGTVTLFAGLQQANGPYLISRFSRDQADTIYVLQQASEEILALQHTTHHLPSSLLDLKSLSNGGNIDAWGHQFQYSVDGSHFRLMSYGLDGVPGGIGLNTDLTANSKPAGKSLRLTMRDFLTLYETQNMAWSAVETGAIAAILCFFLTRPAMPGSAHKNGILARLLILFSAAAFVGTIITALHVPTGH